MRTRELPAPAPPDERTIGQLIAETIRAYGSHLTRALPLGLPIAAATQVGLGRGADGQTLALLAASPAIVLAFVLACRLVHRARPTVTAYAVGLLVFLPVPILARVFVLPAIAWLAVFGLAVPAAMVERLRFRDALQRARRLAFADFVHALGALSALVVVVVVSELTLIALLRSQGDNGQRVAHLLADLTLTPLLYLGGALLYQDQVARVGSREPRRSDAGQRSRDADLHSSVDADAAGRADPQVEP